MLYPLWQAEKSCKTEIVLLILGYQSKFAESLRQVTVKSFHPNVATSARAKKGPGSGTQLPYTNTVNGRY